MDLCLIEKDGTEECIRLDEVDGFVWHAYLPAITPGRTLRLPRRRGVGPGRRSSVRPEQTAALTPTEKPSTATSTRGRPCLLRHGRGRARRFGSGDRPLIDSLGHTMTSVVINPFFDWGSDHRPRRPYNETIIDEAHARA